MKSIVMVEGKIVSVGSAAAAAVSACDVVILDACVGGSKNTALDALRNGDIAAVGAVLTGGVPRFVGRSRNTPATMKSVRVAQCRVMQDYSGTAH